MAIFLNIYRKSLVVFRTGQCNATGYRVSAMNDGQEVCGDTDLVTIALPGATHTCHFLPPAPLLTLLSRASAPPPAAQVWRTPPAYPPVQVETTLHLVQTSMPLLLILPWVQVHQSSPQLLVTSLRNIKPHKCPCYICQCTCSNRCPCICPCTNLESTTYTPFFICLSMSTTCCPSNHVILYLPFCMLLINLVFHL